MDTVICVFLLALATTEIFFLAKLAEEEPLDLKGRAFHPLNIVGFLFLITLIDFANLFYIVSSGKPVEFATAYISSAGDVVFGLFFYVLCQTFVVFGIWAAMIGKPARLMPRHFAGNGATNARHSEVVATRIIMCVSIVATIVAGYTLLMTALGAGSLTYIAGVRTRFFAENPVLLLIIATITPAFFLFGSRHGLKLVLLALPVLFFVQGLIGGRSKLIYLLVGLAYWWCQYRRISVIWVYLGLPILLFAIVAFGYYSRYSSAFMSFDEYLNDSGGMFGALFEESSISMAEAITFNLNNAVLSRSPWESIVGMFMLPIPRSVIDWKPFGMSTDFSMVMDYTRFMLVKSEWTVTGFVDLYYSFGFVGGILACGLLAYLWGRALVRSSFGPSGTALAGPVLIVSAYIFVRGDLYIVSQFLWPCGLVLLSFRALAFLVRSSRKTQPNRKRRQGVVR